MAAPVAPAAHARACRCRSARACCCDDIVAARELPNSWSSPCTRASCTCRARLAPYERALATLAVDAGADVVIGHHAHIVRGIEFIAGMPIFHGLGNGCVVTRALSPGTGPSGARRHGSSGASSCSASSPIRPTRSRPSIPKRSMHCSRGWSGTRTDRLEAGFVPVYVEAPGRPVLATGERAQTRPRLRARHHRRRRPAATAHRAHAANGRCSLEPPSVRARMPRWSSWAALRCCSRWRSTASP